MKATVDIRPNNDATVESFDLSACSAALQEVTERQQEVDRFNEIVQLHQFEVLYQRVDLADTLIAMGNQHTISRHLVQNLTPQPKKNANPKAYGCGQHQNCLTIPQWELEAFMKTHNFSIEDDFVDGTVNFDDLPKFSPCIVDSKNVYNHRIIGRIKRYYRQ